MIFLNNSSSESLSRINASSVVSLNPPVLEIINAQPRLAASRLDLPNGSSHLEHATAILVFLKILITSLCGLNPNICAFLWLSNIFSRFSSPITFAVHSGYLFNIFLIALAKTSYPFALFSLPTNVIQFFFFFKTLTFDFVADW